jgi:hypothetical protein
MLEHKGDQIHQTEENTDNEEGIPETRVFIKVQSIFPLLNDGKGKR